MEESLYIDAIKGAYINIEFRTRYLPKRYQFVSDNGETSKFNLNNFIDDCDRNIENMLPAIYKAITFGPEVKNLYKGFDPICEEEILYNEYQNRYVEKCKSECDEETLMALNFEINVMVDFGILHSLGCIDKKIREKLVKTGFLPEQCFITIEEMEEKTEQKKIKKFFDVIEILSKPTI